MRQMIHASDSGNSSFKNPYMRSGLALGLGGRPETVLFIVYLLVSSEMPDSVVLIK